MQSLHSVEFKVHYNVEFKVQSILHTLADMNMTRINQVWHVMLAPVAHVFVNVHQSAHVITSWLQNKLSACVHVFIWECYAFNRCQLILKFPFFRDARSSRLAKAIKKVDLTEDDVVDLT